MEKNDKSVISLDWWCSRQWTHTLCKLVTNSTFPFISLYNQNVEFQITKVRKTWRVCLTRRFLAVSAALLLVAILIPGGVPLITGAVSSRRIGELKATAWHRPATLQELVPLDTTLLEDDIKQMVEAEDAPDADMTMLVEPNGHLQSTFHVGNTYCIESNTNNTYCICGL